MLFTEPSFHAERLTEASMHRLRASDRVDRHQDCGWHCATGYKNGRVQVLVYANSQAELDDALGLLKKPRFLPSKPNPNHRPTPGISPCMMDAQRERPGSPGTSPRRSRPI